MRVVTRPSCLLLAVTLACATLAAQNEIEPNNTKSLGLTNPAFTFSMSGSVFGNVGGADGFDYFVLQTAAASPGVYRHEARLSASNLANVSCNLVGRMTTPSGFAEICAQPSMVSFGTIRLNAWYGFGQAESIVFRVQGLAGPTGYSVSLQSTAVAPMDAGTRATGPNWITGALSDPLFGTPDPAAVMWIYDDAYTTVSANGALPSPATQGRPSVTQTMTSGMRYIALAAELRNDLCPAGTSIPQLDFPNALLSAQATENSSGLHLSHGIVDAATSKTPINQVQPFEVSWYSVDVAQRYHVRIEQPAGPGSLINITNVAPTGTTFRNFYTLNAGNFPDGWFYGIDISLPDLIAQFSTAALPFQGSTGPAGTAIFSFSPLLLSGVTAYGVALPESLGNGGATVPFTPVILPFKIVIP